MNPQNERAYVRPRTVFIALFLSLVAAGGVAAFMYTNYIRYEARALGHIPATASLVVEINVEQAVVYQPFREHLLSLVELGRGAMDEPGVKAIERLTTLELGVDAREVVYAEGQSGERLLVASGLFRRDGVVAGVAKFAIEQGLEVDLLLNPERVSVKEHGFFGVSQDSSLIWANSDATLLTALQSTTEKLPASEPAVVFRVRAPASEPLLDLQIYRSVEYPAVLEGSQPGKIAISGLTRGEKRILTEDLPSEFDLGKVEFDRLVSWLGLRVKAELLRRQKPNAKSQAQSE